MGKDTQKETSLMLPIILLFAILGAIIFFSMFLGKLLGAVVFFPILQPVWFWELNSVQYNHLFGGWVALLIMSLIAFGLQFAKLAWHKKKGDVAHKTSYGFVILGIALLLATIYHLGLKLSLGNQSLAYGLNSFIYNFCRPGDGVQYSSFILQCSVDTRAFVKSASFSNYWDLIVSLQGPMLIYTTPFIGMFLMGLVRLKEHPEIQLKHENPNTAKNVTELINLRLKEGPSITPLAIVSILNPIKYRNSSWLQPLLGTREFAFNNNIVQGFSPKLNSRGDISDDELIPVLSADRFNAVFRKQLGDVYTSIDALSPFHKLVIGMLLPLSCSQDGSMADDERTYLWKKYREELVFMQEWILESIKQTKIDYYSKEYLKNQEEWDREYPDGYNFSKLRPLSTYPHLDELEKMIEVYSRHPIGRKHFEEHAYSNTLLYSVFEGAKRAGVVQANYFRFLSLWNRDEYIICSSVGRPTIPSEAAAVVAQRYYENRCGERSYQTNFNSLYEALNEHLGSFKYPQDKVEEFEEKGKINFDLAIKIEWTENLYKNH